MNHHYVLHGIAAGLLAAVLPGPLSGQATQWKDTTLADFRTFDDDTKQSIVRQLERKIQLDPNPQIQRIVSMQRTHGKLPVAGPAPYHRAKQWAAGVAPDRVSVKVSDPRHAPVRKRYPVVTVLPDLHKAVWYDWCTGEIHRRKTPLTIEERLENIYNGYPPGSDDALARLLQKFDNDRKMRPLAHYFGHLYADLTAQVFADVTLYEAWYSGEMVDVPDVDAIPFERRILKTRRFKSPIPKSPKRTALYQRIREHAFAFRKYRTLREAAAVAFLRADPEMDPLYKRLVPRFQYLFVDNGDDIDAIEKILRKVPDREALIGMVDRKIKSRSTEYERRKTREKNLAYMFQWLRYWAQVAVYQRKKNGG